MTNNNKKASIYVDLDDTAVDYKKQLSLYKNKYPSYEYPQSVIGFFSTMEPMPGFLEAWKELSEDYYMKFLTRPSVYNLNSYTEKAIWVRDNMGGLDALEVLNLCPDKSIIGESYDYLIDDGIINGQTEFKGNFLRFGTKGVYKSWDEILEYFKK